MSSRLYIDDEYKQECLKDFAKALDTAKLSDGKINFTKVFTYANRKATLYFTLPAYLKMQTLIQGFSTEVAWHGIASRLENESEDAYLVSDILVYPQIANSSTVDYDPEAYEKWKWSLPDEQFNNMRLQGHSHVNMPAYFSSVDSEDQMRNVSVLGDDMFYIFTVWNKSGQSDTKIYDFKKNVMFSKGDIIIKFYDDSFDVNTFAAEAKKMVSAKVYTPKSYGAGANNKQSSVQQPSSESQSDKKEENKNKGDIIPYKRPHVMPSSLESSTNKDASKDSKSASSYGGNDNDGYDYHGREYYNGGYGYCD